MYCSKKLKTRTEKRPGLRGFGAFRHARRQRTIQRPSIRQVSLKRKTARWSTKGRSEVPRKTLKKLPQKTTNPNQHERDPPDPGNPHRQANPKKQRPRPAQTIQRHRHQISRKMWSWRQKVLRRRRAAMRIWK